MEERFRGAQPRGMAPGEVAEHVVNAIRENRFYIFTHPEVKESMRRRFDGALAERNPEPDPALRAALERQA
jgi:hypothetical protein